VFKNFYKNCKFKQYFIKKETIYVIETITYDKIEFDDGSEWTLSKCLTHANRTTNFILNIISSGVQVSNDNLAALK